MVPCERLCLSPCKAIHIPTEQQFRHERIVFARHFQPCRQSRLGNWLRKVPICPSRHSRDMVKPMDVNAILVPVFACIGAQSFRQGQDKCAFGSIQGHWQKTAQKVYRNGVTSKAHGRTAGFSCGARMYPAGQAILQVSVLSLGRATRMTSLRRQMSPHTQALFTSAKGILSMK